MQNQTLKQTSSQSISSFAWQFAFDVREDEEIQFQAIPLLDLPNRAIEFLKVHINNNEEDNCFKASVAYLGYRVITYTGIPTVCNVVSLILTGFLALLTIPTPLTGNEKINRWCWVHFQASLGFTMQSLLVDLTCDARLALGACCCTDEDSLCCSEDAPVRTI